MILQKCLQAFILLLKAILVSFTVDLNIPELQYLADHLEPEECLKLVKALHYRSFELPKFDAAVDNLDRHESCLKLMFHWNSSPGEGVGGTHIFLARRLIQIGRHDLADWLSTTVFYQLSQELKRSVLSHPFNDLTRVLNATAEPDVVEEIIKETNYFWGPFDSVCLFNILVITGTAGGLAFLIFVRCIGRKFVEEEEQKPELNQLLTPETDEEECKA